MKSFATSKLVGRRGKEDSSLYIEAKNSGEAPLLFRYVPGEVRAAVTSLERN
jgi:hypothetical protein